MSDTQANNASNENNEQLRLKAQKKRNVQIGLGIAALMLFFFVLSIVKFSSLS